MPLLVDSGNTEPQKSRLVYDQGLATFVERGREDKIFLDPNILSSTFFGSMQALLPFTSIDWTTVCCIV